MGNVISYYGHVREEIKRVATVRDVLIRCFPLYSFHSQALPAVFPPIRLDNVPALTSNYYCCCYSILSPLSRHPLLLLFSSPAVVFVSATVDGTFDIMHGSIEYTFSFHSVYYSNRHPIAVTIRKGSFFSRLRIMKLISFTRRVTHVTQN
jgi:hypothetical protein